MTGSVGSWPRWVAPLLAGTSLLAGTPGWAAGQGSPPPPSDAGPAQPAAAPADTDAALGEIVVTATKRSESIQRVPISLQALGGQALEQHQVADFSNYAKALPSVSYKTPGPGRTELFFRGLSTGTEGSGGTALLPSSGVYLDEVPITTPSRLIDVHIYDVDRVEALSGPQGTLFGASSLSGTLRIITNKPDPAKFAAGYDVQLNKYGAGKAGGSFEGFVNVPLGDRIAARAVGFYQKEGGYIDNRPGSLTFTLSDDDPATNLTINNGRIAKADFNPVETYGGRLALGIELDDDWTVTPMIVAQHQQAKGSFLYDPDLPDLSVHDYHPTTNRDRWYQAALTIQGKIADFDLLYSGGYLGRSIENQGDYTYYSVSYDTLNPGFTSFPDGTGGFLDPTEVYFGKFKQTKQTHEFRVSTPSTSRARLTAGLFYQRQTSRTITNFFVPGLAATGLSYPGTDLPFAVTGDDIFYTDTNTIYHDSAIFAEGSFDIVPSLTAIAGIRGFRASTSSSGFTGSSPSVADAGCSFPLTKACVNVRQTVRESGETHRLGLTWRIDPHRMVYATYSTGFRPGGANSRPGVGPYKADTVDNYEIGFKATWFRNLRVNASFYYEEWKGIQYPLDLVGQNGVGAVFNAGKARVYGVEGDVAWSHKGLTISGSGAFNDAALAQDFCNLQSDGDGNLTILPSCSAAAGNVAAPKGTRLPSQPKYKGSVTARYDRPIGRLDAFVQGTALYQSGTRSYLGTFQNDLLGNTSGFTTFDLSIGASQGGRTLELFIQNAFDKRGQLSRNTFCAITICSASARVYPIRPQFFGIKFGQRF